VVLMMGWERTDEKEIEQYFISIADNCYLFLSLGRDEEAGSYAVYTGQLFEIPVVGFIRNFDNVIQAKRLALIHFESRWVGTYFEKIGKVREKLKSGF
jgi:hypothetical protein